MPNQVNDGDVTDRGEGMRLSKAVGSSIERQNADAAQPSDPIELRTDGIAYLRGTTIEVHRIAALLAGQMSVAEVCEDYPSLTADRVNAAWAYAKAHPDAGRWYPPITGKRALRGAGLEALDEVLDHHT